ncbi:Xanthine/uracil permease [Ascodesmis nigricans]|uniref:Xanthine/uracil permease n=1 Tax=Ascodesmis nigricans TaxID=341454 RepID=A0A4S2MVI6_9PEZI|nr:Xanthine/uracil permease [Ascodesmis nigricans]
MGGESTLDERAVEVDMSSQAPISPDNRSVSQNEKSGIKEWASKAVEEVRYLFGTQSGLLGDYDYSFLLTPNLPPFNKKYKGRAQPFYGINDRIPLLLTVLLGIQHALAMIGGLVTPPLLVAGASGANLTGQQTAYLVSASLILSGIFSLFQIVRFRIFNTGLWIGTGMLSVVGEAFSIVPIAQGFFANEYASGRCPTDADGKKLPCPEAYGKLLGTVACVMWFQVALSLVKPRILMKVFPKLVTGMVLICIGASLAASGMKSWAGGTGPCISRPISGPFVNCPNNNAPNAKPWGHPSFIGLGFSVYASILAVEFFGSPLLRSGSVFIGLLVGSIIAAATGYIDGSSISTTPSGTFLWTTTFPLGVSGALVLPLMASCITTLVICLGDVVATAEVSGLDVDGEDGQGVSDRVQGGLTGDAIWSVLAPLATTTPTVCFAQNIGVIGLTNCASRRAGYACCIFLVVAGVASKFGAAIVALPQPVIGGMTTFLFTSIITTGLKILSTVNWTRRNRFIATATMVFGISDLLVPDWALYLLPKGGGTALQGFKDGIGLMLRTSYCIVALVGMVLNAALPEEPEENSNKLPVSAPESKSKREE